VTSERESNGPAVSVVVGASAPGPSLEACLSALAPQSDGAEVLVCVAEPSPAELRERFPWARFVERPGALVPELWRDGIDESGGDIVALTIAQMTPAPDWIEKVRAEHARFDVVGGAIEPAASGLRLVDWAEYFCRYARDMLPFAGRESVDLPGDNAAYKRRLLQGRRELYRDGFWEPEVHAAVAAEGVVCWHSPELVVHQGRSFGWRAFMRQRLAHGREFGRTRGADLGRMQNIVAVLRAPLVPFLMTLRVLRQVIARRRLRLRALAALPLLFSFNVAWAYAEARGHLEVLAR
jgi:hypothetical protein